MRIHTFLEYRFEDGVLLLLREEGFDYSGPLELCDRSTSGKIANQQIANSEQNQKNAQTALSGTNTALSKYSSNLDNFMKFGRSTYGANGEFMKDQNTLVNTTAKAGTTNIKGNLALNKLRTGSNSAGYADTAAESQREGERAVTDQLANADASRLDKLTAINQYDVQASALPAEVGAGLYGTSLGQATAAGGVANQASLADQSGLDMFAGDLTQVAAGAAQGLTASCPAEGALYLMDDGTERPVETLLVGDAIAGIDDEAQIIEEIQSAYTDILRVTTENGRTTRNSWTHAFALPRGGFTVAARSLGKTILTADGPSKIVRVESAGLAWVFNIITNGSHTYRADGVWAYGVGEAERHIGMNEWAETGRQLMADGFLDKPEMRTP